MGKLIRNSWSIRIRLILFFIIFLGTVTGSHLLTRNSFASLEKYQIILDMAGRNKEIVEQIILYSNQITSVNQDLKLKTNRQLAKTQLASDIARFDDNLELLMKGGEKIINNNLIQLPPGDPEVLPLLSEIESIWFNYYRIGAEDIYTQDIFLLNSPNEELTESAKRALRLLSEYHEKLVSLHAQLSDEFLSISNQNKISANNWLWALLITNIILIAGGIGLIQWILIKPLGQITDVAERIGDGDLTQKVPYARNNEVGFVASAINGMVDKIKNATNFIKSIEQGDLGVSYHGLNGLSLEKDTLAGALINMREKMKAVASEEEERNWATKGLAIFGEILQTFNDDTNKLSFEIISNVVRYLDANQGGLFIVNEDEDNIFLELIASYAFNKRKYVEKTVAVGEGLAGQAFKDADTIYITDIPENYVDISSGLGGSKPKSVLVIPLKLSDRVFGVMELASLYDIRPYQIAFLERLSENIASNLYAARANEQTKKLLIESNHITEQMRIQEQQMRKNLKVLEETQSEMQKNQEALAAQSFAIRSTLITVEISMDGRILNANDLFLKAIKYEASEIVGLEQSTIVPDSQVDQNQFEKLWQDLRAGIPHYGEYKRVDKNGNDVWLRATYSPIKDQHGVPYKILKLAFDVTSDKRLRLDFKEQLDSFRRSSAIVEFDLDGSIIDANDNFLDLMEYTREEILGKDHSIIVPEEERESLSYMALWHKLRQGSYHIGEVRRITKSGRSVWFQGSFNPILDLDGKPYKIIEFIINITDRKNAEARMVVTKEELQEKEASLIALLNNTDDSIYTIGPNYRITLLNESAQRLYEQLGESVRITSSVLDCLPRNYYYIWKNYYDRALQGEKFSVEQALFSEKTNHKFYLSVYFNPIRDDQEQVTGVAIFARDITDRKQRELDIAEFTKKQASRTARIIENQKNALKSANHEFQSEKGALETELMRHQNALQNLHDQLKYLQNTDSLIIAIDREYVVSYLNSIAIRVYRYWNYYLQPSYYFPDTFPQYKFNEFKALCDRALDGEKVQFQQVFPDHKRKQIRLFSIRFTPVKNESHEVTHTVITANDITYEVQKYLLKALKRRAEIRKLHQFENGHSPEFQDTNQLHLDLSSASNADFNPQDVHYPELFALEIDEQYLIQSPNEKTRNFFREWGFSVQPDYLLTDIFTNPFFETWTGLLDRGLSGETFEYMQGFINQRKKYVALLLIQFEPQYENNKVRSLEIRVRDAQELRAHKQHIKRGMQ